MTAPPSNPGPGPGMTTRHGLLSPELRRDLADLNGQYDAATRARMASVPFALFRLVLPPEGGADRAPGIADLPWPVAGPAWQSRCLSFAHQAAFFARRLLDGAPLAASLVLDLTTGCWRATARPRSRPLRPTRG